MCHRVLNLQRFLLGKISGYLEYNVTELNDCELSYNVPIVGCYVLNFLKISTLLVVYTKAL